MKSIYLDIFMQNIEASGYTYYICMYIYIINSCRNKMYNFTQYIYVYLL